jgi:2-polyprenyl-3-methyl-5-hydroxy-6-metoxy-1,4-benzoquinol methylase
MTVKTWSTPVAAEERHSVPCALCGNNDAAFSPSLSCDGFSYVKCAVCGLVQINPQPVAADVQRRYGEFHGTDYHAYETQNEAAFLDLQERALADAGFYHIERELMGKDTMPRVLDVGCATGAMLNVLRGRGWQTEGVEISPAGEYAARERGLTIHRHSLEDCHLSADYFDVVLASHLIEHLNNPAVFMGSVGHILRPGGYLILTTPNIDGFQSRLLGSRWRSAIFDHLYLFSKHTIRALLAAHDFTVEGIYTWGGLAAGIAPRPIKTFADRAAKAWGLGDVMAVKARKN